MTTSHKQSSTHMKKHDVLVVGAGAGGIATIASLLKRNPDLDIAVIEPRSKHYYQPGWTLVGGGVFERADTVRNMEDVIPKQIVTYEGKVTHFEPDHHQVELEDGERIGYNILVVAAGLKLNWDGIKGLKDALGENGVTSNYHYDFAPYTWQLVSSLKTGHAVFTQPPMPIKCAGAPQKAMYLACDYWQRNDRLKNFKVHFCSAISVLFGVADYVPALMQYIDKYNIDLQYQHNLTEVDGANKTAIFRAVNHAGETQEVETKFDMLHVCPPQCAPDFIKQSVLADEAGWLDVDPITLQHKKYDDIFALGDVTNTPNAKTAAAVRKQAPVVAENILQRLQDETPIAMYDGYGSCPLTVERGKIVLAEFGYGGVLKPTFPTWFIQGKRPSRLSWLLKEKLLPNIYWDLMLKGREWLAKPELAQRENIEVKNA